MPSQWTVVWEAEGLGRAAAGSPETAVMGGTEGPVEGATEEVVAASLAAGTMAVGAVAKLELDLATGSQVASLASG